MKRKIHTLCVVQLLLNLQASAAALSCTDVQTAYHVAGCCSDPKNPTTLVDNTELAVLNATLQHHAAILQCFDSENTRLEKRCRDLPQTHLPDVILRLRMITSASVETEGDLVYCLIHGSVEGPGVPFAITVPLHNSTSTIEATRLIMHTGYTMDQGDGDITSINEMKKHNAVVSGISTQGFGYHPEDSGALSNGFQNPVGGHFYNKYTAEEMVQKTGLAVSSLKLITEAIINQLYDYSSERLFPCGPGIMPWQCPSPAGMKTEARKVYMHGHSGRGTGAALAFNAGVNIDGMFISNIFDGLDEIHPWVSQTFGPMIDAKVGGEIRM